jgi:hypothetical protein
MLQDKDDDLSIKVVDFGLSVFFKPGNTLFFLEIQHLAAAFVEGGCGHRGSRPAQCSHALLPPGHRPVRGNTLI